MKSLIISHRKKVLRNLRIVSTLLSIEIGFVILIFFGLVGHDDLILGKGMKGETTSVLTYILVFAIWILSVLFKSGISRRIREIKYRLLKSNLK